MEKSMVRDVIDEYRPLVLTPIIVPEGLHAQSIDYITSWIQRNKFNCVRLTYSIDMALNPSQSVKDSFDAAVVASDLEPLKVLYASIIQKNPSLSSASTRDTYGAVIQSLGAHGIMVILDNHNSKAGWCCSNDDGNGWPKSASGYNAANSRNFDTQKWFQGLEAMASWGKQYDNVIGYALRNELRAVKGQNNADWYSFVEPAAAAVHRGDPDGLVVIGGVDYALDMSFFRNKPLDRVRLGIQDKTVWEFHTYSWSGSQTGDCAKYVPSLDNNAGFLLESRKPWTGPLWLSEYGWAQENPNALEQSYYTCLVNYIAERDISWAYWALQGTYYLREGRVAYDEGFGLMNKDWSDWRNASFPSILAKAWN